MSETLWARCIRRPASESLIETHREEADNRRALWGQWKSHVSTWAFSDPGVRDVKFHNAVITRQNPKQACDFIITALHLLWKMAYVWASGMCLWTAVHLTKPSPDIWTTVTSHFKGHIFWRSCRCVCSLSIILILNSTEGNVLIITETTRPISYVCPRMLESPLLMFLLTENWPFAKPLPQ